MARGIDLQDEYIKAWLLDFLLDTDDTLSYDGVPIINIIERIKSLRTMYSYKDIEETMDTYNVDLIEAIEILEDSLQ